jgi:hypothetical protein
VALWRRKGMGVCMYVNRCGKGMNDMRFTWYLQFAMFIGDVIVIVMDDGIILAHVPHIPTVCQCGNYLCLLAHRNFDSELWRGCWSAL